MNSLEPAPERPAMRSSAATAEADQAVILGFTVTAPTLDEAILVEAHDALISALTAGHAPSRTAAGAPHGLVVDIGLHPPRVSIETTVADGPSSDVLDVLDRAQRQVAALTSIVRDVLDPLGRLTDLHVSRLDVMTTAAQIAARQTENEARDFVGIAEIAELRGALRQAVQRQTKYEDFPRPVAILKAGPVYLKSDVLDYYERRSAAAHHGTPDGRSPNQDERRRLAAMLTKFLDEHPELAMSPNPGPWLAAVDRPHLLHGATLASAVYVLGGSTTVAAALKLQPRTLQRWLVRAEGRERG